MVPVSDNSLLLEVVVPLVLVDGEWAIEAQARNGIAQWLENFERVTLCAMADRRPCTDPTVLPLAPLLAGGRLRVVELPYGCWTPATHFRHVAAVRKLFRTLIGEHRYLCFANLGWWGAWGTVACTEARRLGRPHSVWLDYVLHKMPRVKAPNPLRELARDLIAMVSSTISLNSVRKADLGLFHGKSVYDGYFRYSRNPHIVHDIHLKKEDAIDRAALEARLAREGGPLRIGYLGRVHPMKGPELWLKTVRKVAAAGPSGTAVQAVWHGDGPLWDQLKAEAARGPEAETVQFPGNLSDRGQVLSFLRGLDVFLFCHLTPESPRNLIEALMSGVPIVGFASPYAEDLLSGPGGGVLVPVGDVEALARETVALASDRTKLRELSVRAWESGQGFDDESVFRHRSDLIKKHLP